MCSAGKREEQSADIVDHIMVRIYEVSRFSIVCRTPIHHGTMDYSGTAGRHGWVGGMDSDIICHFRTWSFFKIEGVLDVVSPLASINRSRVVDDVFCGMG